MSDKESMLKARAIGVAARRYEQAMERQRLEGRAVSAPEWKPLKPPVGLHADNLARARSYHALPGWADKYR